MPTARPGGAHDSMESLLPWLTPALLLGLFGWVRADLRGLRQELAGLRQEMRQELAGLRQEMNARFDRVHRDVAQVHRELAELRERMAKLEGSLEGFLAGRRDREAA